MSVAAGGKKRKDRVREGATEAFEMFASDKVLVRHLFLFFFFIPNLYFRSCAGSSRTQTSSMCCWNTQVRKGSERVDGRRRSC